MSDAILSHSLFCAQEKGGLRAALFCESVKIKGDKGVEKPLGESGLYCEGGTESVHSLPSSSLLYHTNLVLQVCLNMNFKPPLYVETLLQTMRRFRMRCLAIMSHAHTIHRLTRSAKALKSGSITFSSIFSGCHWTVVMRSFFTLSVASTMPSLLLAVTRRPSASFLMASR